MRPIASMVQNPFRPGLYIRSSPNNNKPPLQTITASIPQQPSTFVPRMQMQRMIRVIQPTSHPITTILSPPKNDKTLGILILYDLL